MAALFTAEQLEQIKEHVRLDTIATMKATQKEMLQSAANTATKITKTSIDETSSKLRDAIDEEFCDGSKRDQNLGNNINQSNYNFCREVETIWKRAARAVDDNNKTKAAEIVKKVTKVSLRK